jgi:ectoine hydroxylase-related dioxygenase (phytanoyl-CoA dioxygenase family)
MYQNYERFDNSLIDGEEMRKVIRRDGFIVLDNVFDYDKINYFVDKFYNYYNKTEELKRIHAKENAHFIMKQFSNYMTWPYELRTSDEYLGVWEKLWGVEKSKLIVNQGTIIYAPRREKCARWQWWAHTDQSLTNHDFEGYQSQVNLTYNYSNVIRLAKNSHKLHEKLIATTDSNFVRVTENQYFKYVEDGEMEPCDIKMKAGSMVIWDSRVIHYGLHNDPHETRLVCNGGVAPRPAPSAAYGKSLDRARKCLAERRTMGHLPFPCVLQPRTPRYNSVNWDELKPEELDAELYQKVLSFM